LKIVTQSQSKPKKQAGEILQLCKVRHNKTNIRLLKP